MSRFPLLTAGFLVAVALAACRGPHAACRSESLSCSAGLETPPASAPASPAVTAGRVYLDLTLSMRGFISDGDAIPFTLVQKTMDRVLDEAFAFVGVDLVSRDGFGRGLRRDLGPLQLYSVRRTGGPSPKERYTEVNTDLMQVIRDVGERPDTLSVILTDGVQDLRPGTGTAGVGPGMIKTALVRELQRKLIDRGFGIWLVGIQSDFDPADCYYNVQPDAQGRVNRCLKVERRPAYLWVLSRDTGLARKLVRYLLRELRAEASATDRQPTVEAVEIWPGNLPRLEVSLVEATRIGRREFQEANALARLMRWEAESPLVTAACLQIRRQIGGRLAIPIEVRLQSGGEGRDLALPFRLWRVSPPAGQGTILTAAELAGLQLKKPLGPDSRLLMFEMPYNKAVELAGRGPIEVPLRLQLDTGEGLSGHWVERWSTDDDTTGDAVAGRTLYLRDLVAGTLESTLGEAALGRCLHLKLVRE